MIGLMAKACLSRHFWKAAIFRSLGQRHTAARRKIFGLLPGLSRAVRLSAGQSGLTI